MTKLYNWKQDIEYIADILHKVQAEVEEEEKDSHTRSFNLRGGGDGDMRRNSVQNRTAQFAMSSQLRLIHNLVLQIRIQLKSLQDILPESSNSSDARVEGQIIRINPSDLMFGSTSQVEKGLFHSTDVDTGLNYLMEMQLGIHQPIDTSGSLFNLPSNFQNLSFGANYKEPVLVPIPLPKPQADQVPSNLLNLFKQPYSRGFQNVTKNCKIPIILKDRATTSMTTSFTDLGLNSKLIECLQELQFGNNTAEPSYLQVNALLPCTEGRDVIICASNSSDRILTYCLHVLNLIEDNMPIVQSIILTPSRHLGEEVRKTLEKLGKFRKSLFCMHAKGGKQYGKEITTIRKGPQILIGHPETVLTLLIKAKVVPHPNSVLVLDQMEAMLSVAGIETKASVYGIIKLLSSKIQVILSGSEFSDELENVTKKFMRNPTFVSSSQSNSTGLNPTINTSQHFFINARLDTQKLKQIIVFCNKPVGVHTLSDYLVDEGFLVGFVEGAMSRSERTDIMDKFKKHMYDILVMTDFPCRGIDIQSYDVVFNYDLPPPNNYLHRVGEGGYTPRKGITINLVTDNFLHHIQRIEDFSDITIRQVHDPKYFESLRF